MPSFLTALACTPENNVSRYYHAGESIPFDQSEIVKACRVPGADVVPLVMSSGKYDTDGTELVTDAKQSEDDVFEVMTDGITLDDLQTGGAPFTVLAYWGESHNRARNLHWQHFECE